MKKYTFKVKETETQSRTRIGTLEIHVPDGTSLSDAEDFAIEMYKEGNASIKNWTPFGEYADEGEPEILIVEEDGV